MTSRIVRRVRHTVESIIIIIDFFGFVLLYIYMCIYILNYICDDKHLMHVKPDKHSIDTIIPSIAYIDICNICLIRHVEQY